ILLTVNDGDTAADNLMPAHVLPEDGQNKPWCTPREGRTDCPDQKSNYELFNCNNFNIRYWSWNYRGCWHQTCPPIDPRSEEHTSDLQSLMRTSYAVFCL